MIKSYKSIKEQKKLKKEIEVKIEKIVYEGYGLARLNGKVIFVKNVLPDEKVRIKIIRETKDLSYAKLTEIIEPSPYREIPECKIYEKCGGCEFFHTNYSSELNLKKESVFEVFRRIGGLSDNEINESFIEFIHQKRFFYRNNAQIKVNKKGEPGFYASNSLKVVPFEGNCYILPEEVNKFLSNIPEESLLLTKGFRIRYSDKIYLKGLAGFPDDKFVFYKVNNYLYRIDIDGFFQINNYTNPEFQNIVLNLIEKEYRHIIELYSGAGFFTIPIAKQFTNSFITGVESSLKAVNNGNYNLNLNKIKNAKLLNLKAEEFFNGNIKCDLLIVDPPRAGMDKTILKTIINNKIKNIIYISCNPATFIRDYRILKQNNYKLIKFYLIDNFPLTHHVEVVSLIKI